MTGIIVALWVMVALFAFSGLSTVALIGKSRKPITPSGAIATLILASIEILVLVFAALRLMS